MNNKNVRKTKNLGECAKCVHCRSTMGENATLYCGIRQIMKKKCEHFEGAFVEAFSIPVNK